MTGIINNAVDVDTSRDEELAHFAQELYRNEAKVELMSSAAIQTTSLVDEGDNNHNVNTAVAITVPEPEQRIAPPFVDLLFSPTPPQPQQVQRSAISDDTLLICCDDCRIHSRCCNLTQFSVLTYCPVFAGMGTGIWLANIHFGITRLGLMLTTGAVMVIWIAYLSYFLRVARHWGTRSEEDGIFCVFIQVLTVMYCPLAAAIGLGVLINNIGYWGGLAFVMAGMLIWIVYFVFLFIMMSSGETSGGSSNPVGR